ncbi:unnamed protein product, partial [Pylaiella littoralis]
MGSAVVLALCTPRVRKNLPAKESCLIVPAPLDENVELFLFLVVLNNLLLMVRGA